MLFDMAGLTGSERYKLLTSSITPRPIAWITSLSSKGEPNAAPFSAFNMICHSPAMIALGLQSMENGALKDTALNILETGELVVNLVSEADAEAMNQTSAHSPRDFDEIAAAGLSILPSTHVSPPRIASSPVSFECRTFQIIEPSLGQTVVLAEVLAMHVQDHLVIDPQRLHLDNPAMRLIGRLQGPGWYVRCTDRVQII